MLDATLHSIADRQARRRGERARDRARPAADDDPRAARPLVRARAGRPPRPGLRAGAAGARRPGRRRRTGSGSTSTSTRRSELGETAQVALYTIIRELLDQAVRRGPPTRIDGDDVDAPPTAASQTCVADDAEPERRRRSFEAIEERVQAAARHDRGRPRERAHDGDGDAALVRDAALGDPLGSAPMSTARQRLPALRLVARPATRCARWTASCPRSATSSTRTA